MKTVVTTLTVALLLLAAAALAFIHSGFYNVSASAPHGSLTGWVFHTAMEASVERRADEVQVPGLDDESLLLAGVNDFEAMCVGCHGAPGKEPGPVGQGLNPAPPNLTESAREMTPAELFWVTKHGVRMSGMPAWSATHSDEDLWPLVALMTALPDMDAAAYGDLKGRAEGMGHHGGGSSAQGNNQGHSNGEGASEGDQDGHDHGESEREDAKYGDSSEAVEHDHSTHEH